MRGRAGLLLVQPGVHHWLQEVRRQRRACSRRQKRLQLYNVNLYTDLYTPDHNPLRDLLQCVITMGVYSTQEYAHLAQIVDGKCRRQSVLSSVVIIIHPSLFLFFFSPPPPPPTPIMIDQLQQEANQQRPQVSYQRPQHSSRIPERFHSAHAVARAWQRTRVRRYCIFLELFFLVWPGKHFYNSIYADVCNSDAVTHAPGRSDPCGLAGGTWNAQTLGGDFNTTKWATLGDKGSAVLPYRPTGVVWKRGGVGKPTWYVWPH